MTSIDLPLAQINLVCGCIVKCKDCQSAKTSAQGSAPRNIQVWYLIELACRGYEIKRDKRIVGPAKLNHMTCTRKRKNQLHEPTHNYKLHQPFSLFHLNTI